VAAGSIIENPGEAIVGYDGDAEQTIWAGAVRPIGRPTDAPTDPRLSNFYNQK
jgi:hypothetical protein